MVDRRDPTGIDLRKEFDEFMSLHGYWAVLRQRFEMKKAATFNTSTEEGAEGQKQVLGSGEKYVDRLVQIRRTTRHDSIETPTSLGNTTAAFVTFYLRYNKKPDVHDFICEISQDESSLVKGIGIQPNIPLTFTKIWDIQEVTPMRDRGGRIEFWQLFVKAAALGDTT